ncbi:MAG: mannonate dehydratase [Ruminococcaceae bacterium]|nr:mannonate dehydratase [Oscillospiraceae bacterium]
MKMTFRWYGESDPVTLEKIRQIPGMTGIVSAVYSVPVGEVWGEEHIERIRKAANDAGLEFEVVESVPVHESIKLGDSDAPRLIENYCENIRRFGKAGVKVICYNFMPVFDWLRSELSRELADGSNALAYENAEVLALDPSVSELSLPGWDESYTKGQLMELLEKYKQIDSEKLWENLHAFLSKAVPAAAEAGVSLAIHPDDPPWGIFGLPRIICSEADIDRFLKLVDMPENGLTFCTGSLGVSPDNDIPKMAAKYAKMGRIHFAHLRNILITGERCFEESGHLSANGSLDMDAIVKALKFNGFKGYIRPDHGRMIWGETGKPGYGLFDRALGAAYINGLWEASKEG